MRTIKFRGKDIDTGEWIYGHFFQRLGHYPAIVEPRPRDGKVMYYEIAVEDTTVGQFTGLYDKNGKEIYEGDILRGEHYPFKNNSVYDYYIVIEELNDRHNYIAPVCRQSAISRIAGIRDGFKRDYSELEKLEIIGNIPDNPELLKGGTK